MSNTTNTTYNCNTCIWKADCGNNTWMIEDGVYDERFHCPDYSPIEGEIDIEQDCEHNARDREGYYSRFARQFN